jgi:hypothetical protein
VGAGNLNAAACIGAHPVSPVREIIPAGGFLLAPNSFLQYIIRLAKNSPGRRGRVGGGFGAASPLGESGGLPGSLYQAKTSVKNHFVILSGAKDLVFSRSLGDSSVAPLPQNDK